MLASRERPVFKKLKLALQPKPFLFYVCFRSRGTKNAGTNADFITRAMLVATMQFGPRNTRNGG